MLLIIKFTCSYSQNTLVLTEQSQVNSLYKNFPSGIVDRDLRIESRAVNNLDSLAYLVRINGILEIVDTDIDTLSGLHNLEYVNSLIVIDNKRLSMISPMTKLEIIQRSLYVKDCPLLTNLDAFPNLKKMMGMGIVGDTRQLKEVSGFKSLEGLEGLVIEDNIGVEYVEGFENIYVGSMRILRNKSLKRINGFNGPSKLLDTFLLDRYLFPNSLTMLDNDSLEYVNVFNGIYYMQGVRVHNNNKLKYLRTGENIEFLFSFDVSQCIELDTLIAMNKVKKIRYEIFINYNLELRHIEIFSKLESVRYIMINDNYNITSLNGSFSNLKRVEDKFSLAFTFWLEDIEEFSQVEYFGEINIHHNIRLGICSIPSICNHIQSGRPTNISVYNKPGCKSVNQVLRGCTSSSIDEQEEYLNVAVYPNPFATTLKIENTNGANLNIYNSVGIEIYREFNVFETQIDTSDWPNGLYFIKIKDENKDYNTKIIKIN